MSEAQQTFAIEKLYVKDISLEVPNAPQVFFESDAPQVDVQLNTEAAPVRDDLYEVRLTSTITATRGEKTVFLVEATQAGLFRIAGVPQEHMEQMLAITCLDILFPYLRNIVSDTVTRAGFPPVILNPMNFHALYEQGQKQLAEAKAAH
jgi:preprotein translocase subunit SecB